MNNDRFNFRVWSKTKKQYVSLCWYGRLHNSQLEVENDSDNDEDMPIIEQCTGLRDKNGRLIYEGDVIRVFDACEECDHDKDSDTGIGSVIWLESHGIFYVTGTDSPENSIYDLNFNDYHFEIIGNIHEAKWGIESEKGDMRHG